MGESLTVVGSGAVIVTDASLSPDLQALLTAAVSVEDSLGAIVAALSAHVRKLPSLVCAINETDGIRLLLRGTAEAVVTTDAGEQHIASGSVSTWAEHMLVRDASLVLRHAPGGPPVVLPGQRPAAVPTPSPGSASVPAPPASSTPAASPVVGTAGRAPSAVSVDPDVLASSTLAWLGDSLAGAALPAEPLGQAEPLDHAQPLDQGEPQDQAEQAEPVEPLEPPAGTPGITTDDSAAEPLPPAADAPDVSAEPAEDAAGAAEADPFGFRHLLDETMHVSTEEAAVRPLPEDHEELEPEPAQAAPAAAPEPVPEPEPEPPPIPLPVITGGGLIDSVPGGAFRSPDPTPASVGGPGGPPAPGPVAPAVAAPPARPAVTPGAGAPFASAAARPPVQAVLCDLGHANPVIASECRTCRHPLLDRTPRSVPRPSLGRLVFTDGMVVELDSPVLIGRAPAESMAGPDLRETPKLISLPSQDKRISRLHAEVRLEGWQVYVLDSSSLNGTTVMQPGLPPRQLRSGEPCLVDTGSSVNLGGAVTFTFEGPS